MIAERRRVSGYPDSHPFILPRDKLWLATWEFTKEHGYPPTYVRVSAWTADQIAGCGLEIRVDPWLHRDSLYLGCEE